MRRTYSAAVTVQVVDYGSPAAPTAVADSLRTTGFAVLVNHPIAGELVRSVQAEWLAWFDGDAKFGYLPAPAEQDGYHPLAASERAVGADVADLKEFFHWYPWGRHPDGLSDGAARLYESAGALGAEVLGWLDPWLPPMLEGSHRTLMRILRYPPLTGDEPGGAVRAAAHEDINLLTVLPAADAPGLRVRHADGSWWDVPADPGSVVINAGDMLQLCSGGRFPSATHDVTNPAGDDRSRSRMSTPLFLQPADDVVLAPGVTAFSFLRERLMAIRGVELNPR
jgi:isopenicillin N synthase-like dioxygenase